MSKMSCRSGTYNKKMKSKAAIEFHQLSQPLKVEESRAQNRSSDNTCIKTNDLESVQAEWSRTSKQDLQTTPKGLQYKPVQVGLTLTQIITLDLIEFNSRIA